jgi:murein DD-endopeptidase MepM/ murein hydrolase activator NlpD
VDASPSGRRTRSRARLALVLLPLAAVPVLTAPAVAAPPGGQSLEQLKERERVAAGDLEDSSAKVKAAGSALAEANGRLATARADVAKAEGELAGARAKAKAAAAAVRRAEQALAAKQAEVDAASAQVDEGRADVGRLARRAYQRGRLADLRDVVEAGEPQDVVQRASMLRAVFRSQNDSLARLTTDRLALAGSKAELRAEERALDRARQQADEVAERARQITLQAQDAERRVAAAVAERTAALRSAEVLRAEDLADYQAAQQASRDLAERIRRAAAEAERKRKEAEARAKAAAEAERKRAAAAGKPAPPPQAQPRSGRMLWPAQGRLTSRYGYRTHPIYGDRRFHAGIDIGGGLGARVSAADPGIVTYAGYASGYGTLVVISHGTRGGRDLSTGYAHMGQIAVREGQYVERGQRVGAIGNEGNSTGPHLHFEVRLDGEPVDPLDYVDPP